MSAPELRFAPVEVSGHTFEALDMDRGAAAERIVEEMRSGVAVYYDRRWKLTGTFCEFLLRSPELVRDRAVLVVGAGVGLEAVVVGRIASRVVINDLAPASLELATAQLTRNGVDSFGVQRGSFQDCDLTGIDLIVACFGVDDEATRDAMSSLLARAVGRGVPLLLANEDVGGYFGEVLEAAPVPVEDLVRLERGRIVRVG
jgi:predicted nicotinamide N-methyase